MSYESVASSQEPASCTHRVLCRRKGVIAQAIYDQRDCIAVPNKYFFTAFQGGAHCIVRNLESNERPVVPRIGRKITDEVRVFAVALVKSVKYAT